MQIGGIVLAGGQSRRMGQPKAWLPIGSETMLTRIVRVVSEVVAPVVVVRAPSQTLPKLPESISILHDQLPGHGPLEGLRTGMQDLASCDAVFLSACDTPLLEANFIRRLIESLQEKSIAIARIENRLHPLAAIYRTSLLPIIESQLQANQLRLLDLLDRTPTQILTEADLSDFAPEFRSLQNINTPEEYEKLRQAEG